MANAEIRWRPLTASHNFTVAFDLPRTSTWSFPRSPVSKGLRASIAIAGIPTAPGTPVEEALTLLEAAAELEHALLVEYLYAGFSCQTPVVGQTIRLIARQEMGHLVSVQNLRLLCGGTPYLARQDQKPRPDIDPFPFTLEAASLDVVAKYAVCEMPADTEIPSGMAATVAEIRSRAEAHIGSTIHRVGALYAKIYWLFMQDDVSVGPWTSFPADVFSREQDERGRHIAQFPAPQSAQSLQADSGEWSIGGDDIIVETCGDRGEALVLLNEIASQGEGLSSTADSHFELFVQAYEAHKADGIRALPVPNNPTTDPTARPGVVISHPVSLRVAKLFDWAYRTLQTEILLSLTIDKGADPTNVRKDLITSATTGMTADLRWCATQLMSRLPLTAAPNEPLRAAPAFMPVGTIAGDRASLVQAYGTMIASTEIELDGLAAEANLDAVIAAKIPTFRSTIARRRALMQRTSALGAA